MVWPNFPSPKSSLVADVVFGSDKVSILSNPHVSKTINTHEFNQTIQIVIPVQVPPRCRLQEILQELNRTIVEKLPLTSTLVQNRLSANNHPSLTYFNISYVPLHLLVHRVFIENYIKRGKCFILSQNNLDARLCITSEGLFTLQVSEKLYRKIGIEGKSFKSLPGSKIIEVDLASRLMNKFDSKYYQRIFSRFKDCHLKFDLFVKWSPNSSVSSHSIINFFELMKKRPEDGSGYMSLTDANLINISVCRPVIQTLRKGRQHVPLSLLKLSKLIANDSIDELVENTMDFLGATVNNIPFGILDDSTDVNSFGHPVGNCDILHDVMVTTISGFFSPDDITIIIREINENIHHLSNVPFVSVIVNGFEDAPITWKGSNLHSGQDEISSENLYCLSISRKDGEDGEMAVGRRCLVYRLSGCKDFSIHKL